MFFSQSQLLILKGVPELARLDIFIVILLRWRPLCTILLSVLIPSSMSHIDFKKWQC